MGKELIQAVESFNQRQYFEAGIRFEEATRSAEGKLKDLTTALNQVSAALHLRFMRGGYRGSINLISQALLTLEELDPVCEGIDVGRFRREIDAYLQRLRASGAKASGLRHRLQLSLERRRVPTLRFANQKEETEAERSS